MVDKIQAIEFYKHGMTEKEIGKKFNVSKQRISQIIRPLQKDFCRIPKRKSSRKPNPRNSELWVAKKLKAVNMKVEFMPYNYIYDLLVNKNRTVEVKYSQTPILRTNNYYYKFAVDSDCDFIVAITGKLEEIPIAYILKREEIKKYLYIPSNPKYRSKRLRRAKNNWTRIRN